MSNKNSIIIRIVALSILALVLVGVMIFLMTSKWLFKNVNFSIGDIGNSKLIFSEVYNVNDISSLSFNLKSADLYVNYNDTDEVKLEIYDKKEDNFDVDFNNGILNVSFDNYSYICIGICNGGKKAVLYLPESYDKKMNIISTSGEVEISSFVNSSIDVTTTSGDIKVLGASDANVSSTSGEVILSDISNIKVKTTSGDIEIRNVSDLDGSSTSGELEVYNLGNYINFSTVSGDIDIENAQINKNSKLSTVSGEVDIKGINKIYVNTSTLSGDEDVMTSDRKSDIELTIKTTSGDIEVR